MNVPKVNIVKPMNLDEYKEFKIMMLVGDFKFKLTEDEKNYIQSLKTEDAVDRCVHDMIREKL